MNRNSIMAALAVLVVSVVCLTGLTGCGGGGGGAPQEVVTTPPTQTDPGSGKSGVGGDPGNPGSPVDGGTNPIPNCTPKQVIVTLQGDESMSDYYHTGQLENMLDNKFGKGNTLVINYGVYNTTVLDSLYVSGDVRLENYGVHDMINGEDPAAFQASVYTNTHATIMLTQIAISSEIYNDVPYVTATKAAAAANNLDVADVNGWMRSQGILISDMAWSATEVTPDTSAAIITNVIFPAVAKQVAPLRCQVYP